MRLLALLLVGSLGGCAAPAVGRGGHVYDVIVRSVDGRRTALTGPAGRSCTIQVGNVVRQVWLANGHRDPDEVPMAPVLRADETALREGVALEIVSWPWATFHRVTPDELAAEAALIYVPGPRGPYEVELWFRDTRQLAQSRPAAH